MRTCEIARCFCTKILETVFGVSRNPDRQYPSFGPSLDLLYLSTNRRNKFDLLVGLIVKNYVTHFDFFSLFDLHLGCGSVKIGRIQGEDL